MGRYLKYAIGEIILVMIGILLALQVNNWNEKRLEQKNENKILKDLEVEFNANQIDLNRTLKQHKIVFDELSAIQRITIAKEYNNETLDSLMHSIIKWFTFTQRPGASNNLINSGNLNIISNKKLRDLITQWSGIADDVIDDELFEIDITKNVFLPYLSKNYPISNVEYPHEYFFKPHNQISNLDTSPIIEQKEVDWEPLLNDMEFQSLISLRKVYKMHTISEAETALKYCTEIIDLIKGELDD